MFEKIKNFFIFYFAIYNYPHYKCIDEKLDYLMKNAKSVHYDSTMMWIVIETNKGGCYAVWNCNYPYAWLSRLIEIEDTGKENDKHNYYLKFSMKNNIYDEMLPNRKKMIEFKNWLKKKYEYWEPYKGRNSYYE